MFVTGLPLWAATLIVVVLPTVVAVLAPVIVRRFIPLERLSANNEVAGFKFATVGVLYAVLLAFVVIVVWEKFNEADSFVSKEAAAVTTMYRISADVPGGEGKALRGALTHYLSTVIGKEFRAMEAGHHSPAAATALDDLYTALLNFKTGEPRDAVILSELLRQLDLVTQTRRAQLDAADGVVPGVLWATLIAGAIATLVFTLFFGTKNLRAQSMMTGILSLLLFLGLLIVVSFDHPFSGSVKVTPHALQTVLEDFGGVPEPNGR